MSERARLYHSMEVVADLLQNVKATVLGWSTFTDVGHDDPLRWSIENSLQLMLTHLTDDDEDQEHEDDTNSFTDENALAADEDENDANNSDSEV